MAIPGLKPSFDVRAKVRVGEKRQTAGGREYPASTDYFVCPDEQFKRLAGDRPKELKIMLPYADAADNFSTGLEQWAGAMLVCYTKGDECQGKTAAFRKKSMKKGGREIDLLAGFDVIGEQMGNERMPVHCLGRDCPMMKAKDGCKPMGRLTFYLSGSDPAQGMYQLDTKSWNTVEKIEGYLALLGDPRGQELLLRVEMWSKGTSKFPVVSLEGGKVEVNDENGVAVADACVALHKALANGAEADPVHPEGVKVKLAALLDLTNPGWREREDFIARIKEIGAVAAAKNLLDRLDP